MTTACALGQMIFALGLSQRSQIICVWGRFFIGLSDAQTIMQQTIMCMWFPVSQLPFAYGLMLFLVKLVRTTNDNFASVFYNAFGLNAYFWLGFTICMFSLFCAYLLVQIHESVMVP